MIEKLQPVVDLSQNGCNIVYGHGAAVTVETDPLAERVLKIAPGAHVPYLIDEHFSSEGNFAIQPSLAERGERLGLAINDAASESGQKVDLLLHSEAGAVFEQLLRMEKSIASSLGQVSFLAIPLIYDEKRLGLFSKPITDKEEQVGLEYGGVRGSYRRGRVPFLVSNDYRREVAVRDGTMHYRYGEMFSQLHENGIPVAGLAAENDSGAGWNRSNLHLLTQSMARHGLRVFELAKANHDFKTHVDAAVEFALAAPNKLKEDPPEKLVKQLGLQGIREITLSSIRESITI